MKVQSEETDRKMQETDRKMQETDRKMQETDRKMRETDRKMRETFEQMQTRSEEADRKMRETFEQMQTRSGEADRKMQETAEQMRKTEEQVQRTSREISALGSRVGEIVENMIGGDIIEQFRALGYDVTEYSRNKIFGRKGTGESGEIDLLLEDGDIVILIEVKTTLKIDDVKDHMERLEKYRRHIDEKNNNIDRRKFIGAVAAASVADHVVKFAQRNGLYVIVQSGKMVEIITPPEGFVAKTW